MKKLEKCASGMALHKFSFLCTHFNPLLVSGHVRTAYGAVILNLRYTVFVLRSALSE